MVIANAGVLLQARRKCNVCQRHKPANEMVSGNEKRGYLCTACYYKHHENLRGLSRSGPRACNECGVSFALLVERKPTATMTVHVKDGVLQILCKRCADRFEPKAPQYKGTLYGYRKGYK